MTVFQNWRRKRLEVELAGMDVRVSILEQLVTRDETSSYYIDKYIDAQAERAKVMARLKQVEL